MTSEMLMRSGGGHVTPFYHLLILASTSSVIVMHQESLLAVLMAWIPRDANVSLSKGL